MCCLRQHPCCRGGGTWRDGVDRYPAFWAMRGSEGHVGEMSPSWGGQAPAVALGFWDQFSCVALLPSKTLAVLTPELLPCWVPAGREQARWLPSSCTHTPGAPGLPGSRKCEAGSSRQPGLPKGQHWTVRAGALGRTGGMEPSA